MQPDLARMYMRDLAVGTDCDIYLMQWLSSEIKLRGAYCIR